MQSIRHIGRQSSGVAALAAMVLLALAACGDDGTPSITFIAPPDTPPVSFMCNTDDAYSTVIAGTAEYRVRIVRRGGYDGTVNLSIEGVVPAGVALTFDPTRIGPGTSSTGLIVTASSDAEAAITTVTLRARGDGVPDATCKAEIAVFPRAP